MADRLDQFLLQASRARERAATADGEFRRQWLKVAEMWELLAREYGLLHRAAEDAADG